MLTPLQFPASVFAVQATGASCDCSIQEHKLFLDETVSIPTSLHRDRRVLNDVFRAADQVKVTCLVLLDLSAAFDTVDHHILLEVLGFWWNNQQLTWLHSYLNDRTPIITVDVKEMNPYQLLSRAVFHKDLCSAQSSSSHTLRMSLSSYRHGGRMWTNNNDT